LFRYETWTTPEYYKNANEQQERIVAAKQKEEILEKRREKLRKLFYAEKIQYDIELAGDI